MTPFLPARCSHLFLSLPDGRLAKEKIGNKRVNQTAVITMGLFLESERLRVAGKRAGQMMPRGLGNGRKNGSIGEGNTAVMVGSQKSGLEVVEVQVAKEMTCRVSTQGTGQREGVKCQTQQ